MLDICKKSQKKQRKISFENNGQYGPNWIALHPTLLLKAATYGKFLCKKEFVKFVSEIDNYDNFLIWFPAKNCLAYMDYEHDKFKTLGKWEDFLSDPDAFFEKYLSDCFNI